MNNENAKTLYVCEDRYTEIEKMLFCPQGACCLLQETQLTEKRGVRTTECKGGVNEWLEKIRDLGVQGNKGSP